MSGGNMNGKGKGEGEGEGEAQCKRFKEMKRDRSLLDVGDG